MFDSGVAEFFSFGHGPHVTIGPVKLDARTEHHRVGDGSAKALVHGRPAGSHELDLRTVDRPAGLHVHHAIARKVLRVRQIVRRLDLRGHQAERLDHVRAAASPGYVALHDEPIEDTVNAPVSRR
ncbi:MAG: hypothetical protein GY725_01720 [bacterium]|nr:hypothetical protein [bacterium]